MPDEMHQRLKREAEANFCSLSQEALARIERTFEIDNALHTERDQKWIDEAIASGPATRFNRREFNAIRDRVLKRKAT